MTDLTSLWIPFTLVGACGQVARNAMQRGLTASLGTVGAKKPAWPKAFTRARHASSTLPCGSDGNVAAAHSHKATAKRRWPSLKNGQCKVSTRVSVKAIQLPSNTGVRLLAKA